MNTLNEIGAQMQYTCFVKLYACMAKSIHEYGGKLGERLIRCALREYGKDKGKRMKALLADNGQRVDLQNLYAACGYCGISPYFYRILLHDEADWQSIETHLCPFAATCLKSDSLEEASYFCEDYPHALIDGFTDGIGQAHTGKRLTRPTDGLCSQTFFYRQVHMNEEQLKLAQNGTDASPAVSDGAEMMALYLAFFNQVSLAENKDFYAPLADGLRSFAEDTLSSVADEAERTLRPVDASFLGEFFPLPLTAEELKELAPALSDKALELFDRNVLCSLRKSWL